MPSTLLLDTQNWDLVTDISGNIAVAAEPYALAQDAASAIKLFQGELWFDVSIGVPYWSLILGLSPPVALMKSKFKAAALTVPGVASAVCYLSSIVDRVVGGQVQVTSATGQTSAASFSPASAVVPPSANPSLDFSNPSNSQYLPGGL
jgi:hypothetical protein